MKFKNLKVINYNYELYIKRGTYHPSLAKALSCSIVIVTEVVIDIISRLVRHPYHLVDYSPWPLLSSFAALSVTVGLVV